jgi:ribosomal protein L29
MEINDLRKKNIGELEAELREKRKHLSDVKLGTAKNKTKNVKEQSLLRKEIARIMTVMQGMRK